MSGSSSSSAIEAIEAAIAQELNASGEFRPFPTLRIRDLWQRPGLEWLVEGVIHAGTCCVLYGASRAGKSFIGRDLALAISHGQPWAGHATRQGPVIYIAAEGGSGLRDRFRGWYNFHQGDDDTPLAILDERPDLVSALTDGDLGRLVVTVRALVRQWGVPPAAIFIDTLAKCFGSGEENSARDMGRFVANCETLSRLFRTAVVVIHHSGKDASRGPRGSGALHAGFIATIEVSRNGDKVMVSGQKQKDGPELADKAFEMIQLSWSDLDECKERSSCLLFPVAPAQPDGGGQVAAAPAKPGAVAILAAFGPLGLTGPDWEQQARAAGVARSTFFEARKKALAAGQVKEREGFFFAVID